MPGSGSCWDSSWRLTTTDPLTVCRVQCIVYFPLCLVCPLSSQLPKAACDSLILLKPNHRHCFKYFFFFLNQLFFPPGCKSNIHGIKKKKNGVEINEKLQKLNIFHVPPVQIILACLFSRSVLSDSLRPHGLESARLLCP